MTDIDIAVVHAVFVAYHAFKTALSQSREEREHFLRWLLKIGKCPVIVLHSCLVFSIFSKQQGMTISLSPINV